MVVPVPYGFTHEDLHVCLRQLRLFLETSDSVPMELLRYCIAGLNHGGRVTDGQDRRLLVALLSSVYHEDALKAGHCFFATADGRERYVQPHATAHEEYVAAIGALPHVTSPGAFGLHSNAAISKDLKEANELLDSILRTQPRVHGSSGGVGDDMLSQITNDIAAKLPDAFDVEAVQARYPVEYLQSMNTVLSQEVSRCNRLTKVIRTSLANLERATKGLVVMDADLEALADSLMVGQRPAMWMKRSYPSLKPLSGYVLDLVRRLRFFSDWVRDGLPDDFWLPSFFFTQSFLTGAQQNYARKNGISIDRIDFHYSILTAKPGEAEAPEDGVYVHGCFLEGARYDPTTCVLAESEPKVLFTELPMMWLRPVEVTEVTMEVVESPQSSGFLCPLYRVSTRQGVISTTGHSTNFVMMLKLPSDQPMEHWVKRGVAALMALDD